MYKIRLYLCNLLSDVLYSYSMVVVQLLPKYGTQVVILQVFIYLSLSQLKCDGWRFTSSCLDGGPDALLYGVLEARAGSRANVRQILTS
jgi:hypothetical protein